MLRSYQMVRSDTDLAFDPSFISFKGLDHYFQTLLSEWWLMPTTRILVMQWALHHLRTAGSIYITVTNFYSQVTLFHSWETSTQIQIEQPSKLTWRVLVKRRWHASSCQLINLCEENLLPTARVRSRFTRVVHQRERTVRVALEWCPNSSREMHVADGTLQPSKGLAGVAAGKPSIVDPPDQEALWKLITIK